MLQVVRGSTIPQYILDYIEKNKRLLTPDFSTYSNGRMRAWIGLEAPLTSNRQFAPAPFGYKSDLWIWLQQFCIDQLNFAPHVALIHVGGADCSDPSDTPIDGRGGECGIKMHRDAGYADYRAVGINLCGKATFGYRAIYPHQDRWVPNELQRADAVIERVSMVAGTSVIFNCKNPHFAEVGPNRWCINAWRISDKRREEFLRIKDK